MNQEPNIEQLVQENYFLKSKLEDILKEHSRPHESPEVYAVNMSLLLEEVAKSLAK
jgi:hypothetical protein